MHPYLLTNFFCYFILLIWIIFSQNMFWTYLLLLVFSARFDACFLVFCDILFSRCTLLSHIFQVYFLGISVRLYGLVFHSTYIFLYILFGVRTLVLLSFFVKIIFLFFNNERLISFCYFFRISLVFYSIKLEDLFLHVIKWRGSDRLDLWSHYFRISLR